METELNEIPVMLVRAEGGATGAKDAYLNQPPFHAKLRRESFAEDFALRWARLLGQLDRPSLQTRQPAGRLSATDRVKVANGASSANLVESNERDGAHLK